MQCGSTERLRRHHPDYACPIDVEILCEPCHVKVEMKRNHWGGGKVEMATCQICHKSFQPKRTRRNRLCGNPVCLQEMGRRAAYRRWRTE